MHAFIETLEDRRLLSATTSTAADAAPVTVDTAALQARVAQLQADHGDVATFREQLRALLQENREQVQSLLAGSRETLKVDLAALKAAKASGDPAALDAAREAFRTHRASARADLKALRSQFRGQLATLRDQLKGSQETLKSGVAGLREDLGELPPEQHAHVRGLIGNLKAIGAGSNVTADDLRELANSVRNIIARATPPSQASLDQARAELRAALEDRDLSTSERTRLEAIAQDLLDETGISQADVDRIRDQVKDIWDDLGLDDDDLKNIVDRVRDAFDDWF